MATSIGRPADREMVHVIAQDYIVDGVDHIKDPVNRIGYKLSTKVHIITASKSIIQNMMLII